MIGNELLAILLFPLPRQELQPLGISGVLRVLTEGTARMAWRRISEAGASVHLMNFHLEKKLAPQTYFVLSERVSQPPSEPCPSVADTN